MLVVLLVRQSSRLRATRADAASAASRQHALVDGLDIGLVVTDAQDRLVLWNRDFARLYEPISDELRVGRSFELLLRTAVERGLLPDAIGREEAWIADRMLLRRQGENTVLRAMPGGGWRRITERRLADGGWLSYSIDVTELVTREQERDTAFRAAERAARQLEDAIEALPDGFALYDADDRLVLCNARYRALYQATLPALQAGASFESILRYGLEHGQYPQAAGREAQWLAERLRQHRHPGEPQLQELPGNRWLRIDERITRDGGVAGVRTEVTQLVRREQELEKVNADLDAANARLSALSDTDGLSGIPNRRRFDRQLAVEWSRAQRHGLSLAVLMVDIDHFKRYNDRHGHVAGDECLRRVATLLHGAVRRPSDLVARFGGEEFALLLPHTDIVGAATLAQSCLAVVRDAALPHGDSPVGPSVSLSIGAAAMTPRRSDDDPRVLVQAADAALYRAKTSGRDRVSTNESEGG